MQRKEPEKLSLRQMTMKYFPHENLPSAPTANADSITVSTSRQLQEK
jgi:hypothetical protein